MITRDKSQLSWFDLVSSFGPMLPIAGGTAAAWWLHGKPLDYLAALLTLLYAASILLFLAGMHRGISFRTESGPRLSQIITTGILYGLGLFSLVAAVMGKAVLALAMLILGYAAILAIDPTAGLTAKAPVAHARLRLFQTPIAIVSLAGLLWLKLNAPY